MSTKVDVQKVIQEVRRYPELYDQRTENYKNSDYREKIWKQIAKDLKMEGGAYVCKTKWTHVRDQFRKTLKKRRTTTSGIVRKYKYEDIMQFLVPHLSERDSLSNIPLSIEWDDDDLGDLGEDDYYLDEDTQDNSSQPRKKICVKTEGLSSPVQEVTDVLNGQDNEQDNTTRSESKCCERAFSQLMSYILEEKKAGKLRPPDPAPVHPVDAFLVGIAPSLKTLNPLLLNEAKSKIFTIVQELELKQLTAE